MLHAIKNPPKRTKMWCGPSALAIITGEDYETCRYALSQISGRPVMGVYRHDMATALWRFGYSMDARTFEPGATLASWLRSRSAADAKTLFLVVLSKHYIVVQGRKACDNHTKEPVFIGDMRLRRARIQAVYEISELTNDCLEKLQKAVARVGGTYALDPTGKTVTVRAKRGKTINGWTSRTFTRGDAVQMATSYLMMFGKAA
jgi:hypothetical protein